MPSFLIIGVGGSGKTTVIHSLQKRGYAAYNTDTVPGSMRWEDMRTGMPIPTPEHANWSVEGWNWYAPALSKLLASDRTVYIGAIPSNRKRFYSWFEHIFVLCVDNPTLEHRLITRTGPSQYGKDARERAGALRFNLIFSKEFSGMKNVTFIKSDQSVDTIIAEILTVSASYS